MRVVDIELPVMPYQSARDQGQQLFKFLTFNGNCIAGECVAEVSVRPLGFLQAFGNHRDARLADASECFPPNGSTEVR